MTKEKFSYSKLSTYESCGWSYKLKYLDKHFVDTSSIANEFGTLVHYIEETIANDIIANDNEPNFMIDDQKYIDLFINADIHNDGETILGVKKLKEKYPEDFYKADKSGFNYEDKANDYLNNGIYRLRDYLATHRDIHIVGAEIPFKVEYRDYIFQGYIDRLLIDISTGEYIIEDIKTWATIDKHDLITPLQFVFYTKAVQELYGTDKISCCYDLPLAKGRYSAGTKGYMDRGYKKINKLLDKIEAKDFEPKPSVLCHWCPFSATYPNQPEEAKNLCPYFSHWTRENKDYSVENEWMGIENHEAILEAFINKSKKPSVIAPEIKAENITISNIGNRRFLIRKN